MKRFAPSEALTQRQLLSRDSEFHWTPGKFVLSVFLFLAAGLCEIGGGWLVWQAVRGVFKPDSSHWWRSPKALASAVAGSVVLIAYGFLPTAQPPPTFGRLYAVYGVFFIILSFAWGWIVDKDKPDTGAAAPIWYNFQKLF